jgi:transcriptional regulator of acetoin/glycerol metabolism
MEVLLAHSWPGNVRELENVIEYAMIIAKQEKILLKDLPQYLLQQPTKQPFSLEDHEKNLIIKILEETNWNKHQTAKRLKITRSTLYGKIKRFGLTRA